MARPVIYYNPLSCQSVLLVVKAAEIDVELKLLDMAKGEHMSADYIKVNSDISPRREFYSIG